MEFHYGQHPGSIWQEQSGERIDRETDQSVVELGQQYWREHV
jgi:hypothetical protein